MSHHTLSFFPLSQLALLSSVPELSGPVCSLTYTHVKALILLFGTPSLSLPLFPPFVLKLSPTLAISDECSDDGSLVVATSNCPDFVWGSSNPSWTIMQWGNSTDPYSPSPSPPM